MTAHVWTSVDVKQQAAEDADESGKPKGKARKAPSKDKKLEKQKEAIESYDFAKLGAQLAEAATATLPARTETQLQVCLSRKAQNSA